MEYEPVIGLEVHAQLLTRSKIFCGCSTTFGEEPNTQTCPVCTGQPGSLPVTNRKAVEFAIKLGLATSCRITPYSLFARKNYFYPDLPKGYQISMYEYPLAENGFIDIIPQGEKEKKRIKIIQRMILEGNVDKIAHDEGVSESTVRNIWSEAKSGVYPEYAEFIPIAAALRNLNVELTTAGVTVTQAAMGLAIFTALVKMDIEPAKLRGIVEMLKGATGGKPPAGFGKIVEELAKLRAETRLDFQQLNNHLAAQRSELSDVQAKVKASGEELASVQSKIAEANEDLSRRLKQNNTTFKDIEQFRESRRTLRDAGYGFDDVNGLVDFIKTARAEGFLQASKELAGLQKETGLDFKGILQEYRKRREDV
jgi:predicted transcriptional regulator